MFLSTELKCKLKQEKGWSDAHFSLFFFGLRMRVLLRRLLTRIHVRKELYRSSYFQENTKKARNWKDVYALLPVQLVVAQQFLLFI